MKKISLYIISLFAAVAFTACDEDYTDWNDPQSNPKEDPVTVTFQATNISSETIDLGTITEERVAIARQSSLVIEEGNTVAYEVCIGMDDTFAGKHIYEMQANNNDLSIALSDLQEAIIAFYGKRPDTRELSIRVDAYVKTSAGQASYEHSNTLQISVIPQAPVIESAYYLIGNPNGWDMGKLDDFKFSHSGKDVYDDPVFNLVLFLAEPLEGDFNAYFKIVPESSRTKEDQWDGVLGCKEDGSTDVEGALVTENSGAMRILEPGLYRISLNMMDYEYSIERLGENMPEAAYYMIGTLNGWNASDASSLVQFTHSGKDVVEDPYFTLLFESPGDCYWKLVPLSVVEKLKAGEIGNVWTDGILGCENDGDDSLEGALKVRAGDYDPGAMVIKERGWVKVTLNMMEYSYKVEVIGEMPLQLYVPGGHQGWSPETAPILYTRNYDMKYEGYIYMEAENGFKIITEPSWSSGTHYGEGGEGTLSTSGGDILSTEEGYFKFDVNLVAVPPTYKMTKTTWGLIGSATEGGWDNSTPMTYNSDSKTWTVVTTLGQGEFKFRANNGWDINLGGDLNNLGYGGDNITPGGTGEYTITLDLSNPVAYKATVVKN